MAEVRREFRAETYAVAAQEHATAAVELHEAERFGLAHYVAGLAVECMFRAFKSRLEPELDERHDLYRLAKAGRFFDTAPKARLPDLLAAFGEIVTRWDNAHRFRSEAAPRRFLVQRRLFAGQGDLLKNSSRRVVNAALQLVNHGALAWKN